MRVDSRNALSQNTLAYIFLMTSRGGRALNGNVAYVALVLSLMVLICLWMFRTVSSLEVTFTTNPTLARPFFSEVNRPSPSKVCTVKHFILEATRTCFNTIVITFWFFIISAVPNFMCLDVVTKNSILFISMMSIAIVTFLCYDIIPSGIISSDVSTWPFLCTTLPSSAPMSGKNTSYAISMSCFVTGNFSVDLLQLYFWNLVWWTFQSSSVII